jgi:hypothetical protein
MIEENQEHEDAASPAEDSPARQAPDDQSDERPHEQLDDQLDEQALAEILAEDELIDDEGIVERDPGRFFRRGRRRDQRDAR